MIKFVTALIATLGAIWILAGTATGASAHRLGCNCGPNRPSVSYRTIHPATFLTHYHDTSVTKHVERIHRVITVTRVQPIIHISDIMRVHHHTIIDTRNAYESETQHLTPIRYVEHSVQNTYDCSCRP